MKTEYSGRIWQLYGLWHWKRMSRDAAKQTNIDSQSEHTHTCTHTAFELGPFRRDELTFSHQPACFHLNKPSSIFVFPVGHKQFPDINVPSLPPTPHITPIFMPSYHHHAFTVPSGPYCYTRSSSTFHHHCSLTDPSLLFPHSSLTDPSPLFPNYSLTDPCSLTPALPPSPLPHTLSETQSHFQSFLPPGRWTPS